MTEQAETCKALREDLINRDLYIEFINNLIIDLKRHAESLGCRVSDQESRETDCKIIKEFLTEQDSTIKKWLM
jgi:hypothetical protein